MKRATMALMVAATGVAAFGGAEEYNWKMDTYEPRTPVLTGSVASGFHGCVTDLERLTPRKVAGFSDANREWNGVAWRNERVNAQFVLWTRESAEQVRLSCSDLVSAEGEKIPAAAGRLRFLRYVLYSCTNLDGTIRTPEDMTGDCLDTAESVDMPQNGYRPFWFTVDVPAETKAGTYSGTVTAVAQGSRKVGFKVSIKVLDRVLPDSKDWKFYLDLWQHPLAVARYHGVKPWSKEHYAMLRPLLETLADCGQKTITAAITDLPWNHQSFDPYLSLVKHVKGADGKFTQDYTQFDEWVEFALSCGIGPKIHCYTMVPWGNIIYWIDGATGDRVSAKLVPGTKEHEDFWGQFVTDFEKHLEAKGWLGRTYIAMDERSREELEASANILKKYAPRLKIQLAGNKAPSDFDGITIDSYASCLRLVSEKFKREAADRRAKDMVTTFYICCGPAKPNTFTYSAYYEQRWLGLYAAAQDLDGMVRWAAFNWPRDPFFDSAFNPHFGVWAPGDTWLLYPGARYSVRMENFRDSIENFEKIHALRAEGKASAELEKALKGIDFKAGKTDKASTEHFRACVEAVEKALEK